jgi:hypothetical protein
MKIAVCVYSIKMKRPRFEMSIYFYSGLWEIPAKFCTLLRMRIEVFISFILLVENEIKKENTNFRQAISSEERRDVCKMQLLILLFVYIHTWHLTKFIN